MHLKMTMSAYIFEKSRKGPILRSQIGTKDSFSWCGFQDSI